MKSMKSIVAVATLVCAGILAGCSASAPPAELINARQAYQHASEGRAAELVPAELHKAHEALAVAEKSFQNDPKSFRTRDLAYIADRKSRMADALAVTAAGNAATAQANKEYQATQTEIMKTTKENLAASEREGALKAEQLATSQKARFEAERRATEAQADLAKLAAVKEEPRGLVITLSGSVLFASNKSTLLPAAKERLNQVADALMATKDRRLTVEGHTDSQGSSDYNQGLSQKRADAVRSYFIARGYPGELILAQGIGKDRPVSDNGSVEGRANNRRVEIIMDRSSEITGSIVK
jgi:outer membrane protein OmpA-like peptidoglycan-associated protein